MENLIAKKSKYLQIPLEDVSSQAKREIINTDFDKIMKNEKNTKRWEDLAEEQKKSFQILIDNYKKFNKDNNKE